MHPTRPDSARSSAQRWAAGIIGALLLGLGFDALLAAWQARPSLLSRIGPLP